MKLKKIASLMLAGIMAVSMLAGCKSGSTNNGNAGSSSSTPASTGIVASVEGALKTYAPDEKVTVKTNDMLGSKMDAVAKKYTYDALKNDPTTAKAQIENALKEVFDTTPTEVTSDFATVLSWGGLSATNVGPYYAYVTVPVEKVYGISAQDYAAVIVANMIGELVDEKTVSNVDYNMSYILYVDMVDMQKNDGTTVPCMVAVMETSAKKA